MRDPEIDPDRFTSLSRRDFLRRASAAALTLPLVPVLARRAVAAPVALVGVAVRPREDWAGGLAPTGPLTPERPEDVRFLLVHHTASPSDYEPAKVPELIRGFYALHTGPSKNWPDVAYNFFVDRYGTVWEGRAGSLSGPVQPDATGGSQGFAQLCCFIGDHSVETPTEQARTSMVALLAALADAYAIDTAPGATTTFVSRGSNRWPAGTAVTAATISGHRDMSMTACPGDAAYSLVRDAFPAQVSALRAARVPQPPGPPSPPTTHPVPAPPALSTGAVDPAPPIAASAPVDGSPWQPRAVASAGAVAATAFGLGALWLRRRDRPRDHADAWRVHETAGSSSRDDDGAPRARAVATFHEQEDTFVVAALAAAPRPSPAVRATLDACRRGAREIGRESTRGAPPRARAVASLLTSSVRDGSAAVRGSALPDLGLAVVLVAGREVVVAVTDDSMAAVLTATGDVRRPALDRPADAGTPLPLYRIDTPEEAAVAVVLSSPAPAPPRGGDELPGLCRRLMEEPEPDRALAAYQHSYYGATGTSAGVVAVIRATLPHQPVGRGRA